MDNKAIIDSIECDYRTPTRQAYGRRLASFVLLLLLGAVGTVTRGKLISVFVSSSSNTIDSILATVPLTDGHNDMPIWTRAFYNNHIYQSNFSSSIELYGQVDFPRLRKGRLGAQFWSVYVECPRQEGYNEDIYHEVIRDTFQQIDLVHRLTARFPDFLIAASSAADVQQNFIQHPGHISSLMGIEGLHQIGISPAILRMYYQLGVRYASLTHNCHNRYADSVSPKQPLHGGLSVAGQEIVMEMNRLGMAIDLSHSSLATQDAVLKQSRAPVMYSHSSAYAVCPHDRNVPDEFLQRLKVNGGIVMVTFYPEYTNCADAKESTLEDVADHIIHIGGLIGFRHVGLGADFDGMPYGVKGLEDVSKYPNLLQRLLERGVSVEAVKGVSGGNVLRVLKEVEHVASTLTHLLPLEDDVKPFF